MPKSLQLPPSYQELLQELKGRIRTAQVRTALAVNRELVVLYWSIGRDILARQATEGWGTQVIDRLAHDLQNEFPGIEGFSPRSLKYMRALAEAWPEEAIVQQLIAQLPWVTMCGFWTESRTGRRGSGISGQRWSTAGVKMSWFI